MCKLHVNFESQSAVPADRIEAALQQHGVTATVNQHFSSSKADYSARIRGESNVEALDTFCAERGLKQHDYVAALALVANESSVLEPA
ncbi:MAG: hypothetical protein EON60_00025 [Alphaproteobacteria bacterium]|nr:MAG: hypothetical protein EON60_00025 [Alphaproteobacteria bacterium]